jgi:hypothetical protein
MIVKAPAKIRERRLKDVMSSSFVYYESSANPIIESAAATAAPTAGALGELPRGDEIGQGGP